MCAERLSENVVICIDCSRSMYRTDYFPSRLKCTVNAVKTLIEERIYEDNTSSFAIVQFANAARKVTEFTNVEQELYRALDSIRYGGYSAMGDGLALSVKLIIGELRKAGAKIPRILVISDGNFTTTEADPIKMARYCQGLSIKIDTFRLGEITHLNILKKLSDLTGGRHYYNNDAQSLKDSAVIFAHSNMKVVGSGAEFPIEHPSFLRKIAANLLREQDLTKDQEQRIKEIRGEANFKKCSICFAENDPMSGGSFLLSGRYCPNCQMPYHIHCLSGWADAQLSENLLASGTCRCPHCFYLLKIPTDVIQAERLKFLSDSQKTIGMSINDSFPAKYYEDASILGEEALFNSCPFCNLIFDKGQKIIQCGNPECKALYHEDCFKKLKDNQCKNCDVRLELFQLF